MHAPRGQRIHGSGGTTPRTTRHAGARARCRNVVWRRPFRLVEPCAEPTELRGSNPCALASRSRLVTSRGGALLRSARQLRLHPACAVSCCRLIRAARRPCHTR
eukprot:scaffold137410_cov22-Tisochrysis_lutea.AAC.1